MEIIVFECYFNHCSSMLGFLTKVVWKLLSPFQATIQGLHNTGSSMGQHVLFKVDILVHNVPQLVYSF